MKRPLRYATLLVIGIFTLVSFAYAEVSTSTNFKLERSVFDAAGGLSTSTGFFGQGDIGQIGTGISTSTSFILRGGFFHFPQALQAPTGGGGGPLPSFGGGGAGPILTPEEIARITAQCDFNGDRKCNFIDLSILLYYYGRERPEIDRFDLNRDRTIDIGDISVIMYYWAD